MAILYEDRYILLDEDAIIITMYYFPIGSKRIPYDQIRSFEDYTLGVLTGKYRLWGASDPRYWFHLDPARPKKQTAIILDKGGLIKAVITPDDPQTVLGILRDKVRR